MFSNFPFFRSENFDEAFAIHEKWQLGLTLRERLRAGERMETLANVCESPLVGLYGYRYEKSVTLNALASNPDFWISIHGTPNAASICRPASPGDDDPMELYGGRAMLGMRLDGNASRAFVEGYIGEPLLKPLRISAESRASGPADRLIARHLGRLAQSDVGEVAHRLEPKAATRLLEDCLEALLLFRDHSHVGFVRRASRAPAPRDVRRVLDYIHAHASERPSLLDLAAVAGVPGRTLSLHFHQFVGTSPVAYTARIRLLKTRDLLRKREVETVAKAALSQGFSHLGRFSARFFRAFGEYPSETLRRAFR